MLPNQSGNAAAKDQSAMQRASPGVWRSSAVGAGAVALAGRFFVRQLRSPPKAWRVPRAAAFRSAASRHLDLASFRNRWREFL